MILATDKQEPLWVLELRKQTDGKSLRQIGEEIGYSSAVISQALKGKYPGDTGKVESAVRGAYMGDTVGCPILGELPTNKCQENQRAKFAATNPTRVQIYRACRDGCPHSTINQ